MVINIDRKILFCLVFLFSISLAHADTIEQLSDHLEGLIIEDYLVLKEEMQEGCNVGSSYIFPLVFPSALVALALILISVFVYFIGQVFNSKEILGIAKEEFYQSGISIFLAFLVLSPIFVSNTYINLFGYRADTIIDMAMFVAYDVTEQLASDISAMIMFNGVLTYFAASTLSIGSFHSQISFSPGLALKPLTDVITLTVQFLSVGLSEWMFHIFSLCMIKKWAISVFLPLGMLMRAIPHTRDGGSGIIALMLVLYIIYPLTFLGMGSIYYEVHKGLNLQGLAIDFVGEFGFGTTVTALVFMFITQTFLIPIVIFGGVDTVMIFVKEAVFMFFVMSLILPFISILIALTATKELAKNFFGAEINLSSIIRVI